MINQRNALRNRAYRQYCFKTWTLWHLLACTQASVRWGKPRWHKAVGIHWVPDCSQRWSIWVTMCQISGAHKATIHWMIDSLLEGCPTTWPLMCNSLRGKIGRLRSVFFFQACSSSLKRCPGHHIRLLSKQMNQHLSHYTGPRKLINREQYSHL